MKPSRALTGAAALILATSLTGCGAVSDILNSALGGEVSVSSLQVGDCLDVSTEDDGPVSTSPKVPCDEPHEDEVFKIVTTDLPEFPGEMEMFNHADDVCEPHFEDYVGIDYWESEFFIWAYTPTASSWENGDREIICILSVMDEPVTGSMKGSGR